MTSNPFQDILDILTGRKKPTAEVDTTVTLQFDQTSMLNMAIVALAAGTLLIFISIGAHKLIK